MQKQDIKGKQRVLAQLSHMTAINPEGKAEIETELIRLEKGFEKAKTKPTGKKTS